ncbi:MAG: alpha/beta hydrolase [Gammaproteobacteria bacterium]|nr:alpha/beta hydrolase [Gammaproteobacteria bacterium]
MCHTIIKNILVIFISVIIANPAFGEIIQLKISDKITANAEYYPGETNKPYIFILHGFMQTHSFPTVKRLAESLNESDYNVLTPSLSLGISHRKKSLACEAIHTHSLEKDVYELEKWITWLEKQSNQPIILIGHSAGSIHLANYLSKHPSNKIKQIIFIAIPNFNIESHADQINQLKIKAEELVLNKNNSLHDFKLAYCEKYPTSAENFLSYLQLSKENIMTYLDKITIPKILIVGSKDKRVDQEWSQMLTQHGIDVIKIDGANHFFNDEYEFDLLDIIESLIINNKATVKNS